MVTRIWKVAIVLIFKTFCCDRDAMFGSKDATCPFFAFFSLADVLDTATPDGIVVGCKK